MNPLLITSPFSQGPQFSFEPKLLKVQNQNTTSFMSEPMCHWMQRRIALFLKAKFIKIECLCITVIQGKLRQPQKGNV